MENNTWKLDNIYGIFSLNRNITINQNELISNHFKINLQTVVSNELPLTDVNHMLIHYLSIYRSVLRLVKAEIKTSNISKQYLDKFYGFGKDLQSVIPDLIRAYSHNKELVDELSNLGRLITKTEKISETKKYRLLDNIDGVIEKIRKLIEGNDEFPHTLINDYNKIISSSSFRRLQDKAQVFPLEMHDYARTRLTHTLEVASIAREITDIIGRKKPWNSVGRKYTSKNDYPRNCEALLDKVVESASLLHDMGNPPFGHYGEDIIRKYFQDNWTSLKTVMGGKEIDVCSLIDKDCQMYYDFAAFDGNAQSLRVITKLQIYRLDRPLELATSILGAIIKYPYDSVAGAKKGKMGYFYSEEDIISQLALFQTYNRNYRNPCSMILEAADDISYTTSDFDDAIKKGVITQEVFDCEIDKIGDGDDASLKKFAADYKVYIKKSRDEGAESPFTYTMSIMISNLKKRLIVQAANAFCAQFGIIMDGIRYDGTKADCEYATELLKYDCVYDKSVRKWISVLFEKYLYNHAEILQNELKGESIMLRLIEEFTNAILKMDFEPSNQEGKKYKLLENKKQYFHEYKVYSLISPNFIENFEREYKNADTDAEKVYCKMRLAVDYVSGMTDSYALECYQLLSGIK